MQAQIGIATEKLKKVYNEVGKKLVFWEWSKFTVEEKNDKARRNEQGQSKKVVKNTKEVEGTKVEGKKAKSVWELQEQRNTAKLAREQARQEAAEKARLEAIELARVNEAKSNAKTIADSAVVAVKKIAEVDSATGRIIEKLEELKEIQNQRTAEAKREKALSDILNRLDNIQEPWSNKVPQTWIEQLKSHFPREETKWSNNLNSSNGTTISRF